jgi:hypothetical protein
MRPEEKLEPLRRAKSVPSADPSVSIRVLENNKMPRLSGDHDHWHCAEQCVGRAGREIQRARPECCDADAWFTGESAVGCRHEGRGLLIPLITSCIDDLRIDSTTSRFSSPGILKIRSTPSFSRAATRRSEPLTMHDLQSQSAIVSRRCGHR